MDWSGVLARLGDLPTTYKRPGPNFAAWQNSLAAAISRGTDGVDTVISQVDFKTATGRWLDVYGIIFNVPRHPGEGSDNYRRRIADTCTAWSVTAPAIEAFVSLTRGIAASVTENIPKSFGWRLGLSADPAQLADIAQDLQNVRPAGVPYLFAVTFGGLYIGTVNFLGAGRTTGAYLSASVRLEAPALSPGTINRVNTIPTTLLTDPSLNPGT